eukprot:TRINITY_DN2870_c0_g1_i1.p1 TRINITY_DN2870_c0_g1~~TRINITY_DN2870_c0_g1_i1.p1  ORF type:complete len:411 (-),score=83.56 TRINITY_DN2870_c0_g1_i1:345-1577(-)
MGNKKKQMAMLHLLTQTADLCGDSDADFVGSTLQLLTKTYEDTSIRNCEYRSLISADQSELINDIVSKENMCSEVLNFASFLVDKNRSLEESVQRAEEKSQWAEMEVERLTIKINAMQEDLEECARLNQEQGEEVDRNEKELKEVSTQLRGREELITVYEKEIDQLNEELHTAKDQFEKEQRNNERSKELNERLQKEISELNEQIYRRDLQFAEDAKQNNHYLGVIKEMEKEQEGLELKIEIVHEKLIEKDEKLKESEKQLAFFSERLRQKESSHSTVYAANTTSASGLMISARPQEQRTSVKRMTSEEIVEQFGKADSKSVSKEKLVEGGIFMETEPRKYRIDSAGSNSPVHSQGDIPELEKKTSSTNQYTEDQKELIEAFADKGLFSGASSKTKENRGVYFLNEKNIY